MRYVAFLRAINVGGRTVKMDALRRMFEAMGFAGSKTFIASGNVIFESSKPAAAVEKKIEDALHDSLGYDVPAFIRTAAELALIVRRHAQAVPGFGPTEALYVGFLKSAPKKDVRQKILALSTPTEVISFDGRELYVHTRATFRDSILSGPRLEKMLGMPVTMRNARTVIKLAALLALPK